MSVVIPVKDDAPLLDTCLAALNQQDVAALEIIVVDDGSSDASAEVARRHGATVLTEIRPGMARASAAGYDHAAGDIIARLDADSVPASNWIRTIITAAAQQPGVDAFTGSGTFTDGPPQWQHAAARLYLGAYYVTASLALTHVPLFGSNFAMRRTAWIDVRNDAHLDDTGLHDDFDLAYHLGRTHRIRYIPGLRLGISMRPLLAGGGMLRTVRGFRTVLTHWPHDLPRLRLARRAALTIKDDRLREFQSLLAVDALNIALLLTSPAWTDGRRPRDRRRSQRQWVLGVTATSSWTLAALANRQLQRTQPTQASADPSAPRARRLVILGLALNTLGATAGIIRASTMSPPRRSDAARNTYLLVGGTLISVAYLKVLRPNPPWQRNR